MAEAEMNTYELFLTRDSNPDHNWESKGRVRAFRFYGAADQLGMKISCTIGEDLAFVEPTHEQKKDGYVAAKIVRVQEPAVVE